MFNLQPLPPALRGQNLRLTVPTLYSVFSIFLLTSPILSLSRAPPPASSPPPHLININLGAIKRDSTCITKDSTITQEFPGVFFQEPRTKNKYFLLYYNWLLECCY